ncbi:hypothetical protein [Mycobacterium asiaticum]|uniref:hypothetical protein n=1 Tax=Mycobacterium asiaticum TaxID=1790 RepID=UPI000A75704C|nr:hypothetical protein [Mycobacterium asiaticum]
MKPRTVMAVAGAAILVAGCSTHRVVSPPAVTRPVEPTTVAQLCDAQKWPRPVPDVVGRLLYQVKDGSLGCWDHIRAVAPDGHDPLSQPTRPSDGQEKAYRISAVSPAVGTPVDRHGIVTVELVEADASAPSGLRPCDWVTAAEAAEILGGSVTAEPLGDQTGSVDIACIYDKPVDVGDGVEIDLQVPGAFPVDAARQFGLATSPGGTGVDGIGVRAACVYESTTTPPSTTLVVLLNRDRLFRVTQGYASCNTLKRFAQLAIGRIG